MRRYESYKDSGVEWLRQIPSHWDMQRSKFIFKKIERKVNEEDQIVTCFRDGQVTLRANRRTEGFTNALKEHGYQGIRKGDLVIHAMDAFAGAIGISDSDGKATPVYSVCLPHNKQKIDVYFYSYYLRNLALSGFISSLAKGIRERSTDFRYADFAELLLPIPPYLEQQKIVQFLNDKTAKIDQAVDLAEKQIALLKEHKQILIQNAVTRGLNPDVPLKDSGVEWIGQVPEHWDIKRFHNLFDFGKGLSITKENLQDEGIPCVNYGEVHSRYGFEVIPERDALKCVDSKYLVFNNSMLNKGDFVFADTSEDIEGSGNFTYLNSSTRIFAGYHTVITRLKITAIHRYIAYYFDSLSFRNQIRNKVKGVKVFSITQSILKGTFVLLPNLKEQQQIADYLDTQTAKIDQAIALKTAHIEKLKEYKSVLINDVVTGKVRV
ncbi:TPA: restriction endonuclease subunit S [Haemophilus influenzae 10810]